MSRSPANRCVSRPFGTGQQRVVILEIFSEIWFMYFAKSNIVLEKGHDSEDAHRRDSMNAEPEN